MNEELIFTANLAVVIAHSILLHAKGDEPVGEVWATNAGDVTGLGFLGSLFTKEPEVPKFKKVDTTKEQAATVAGNTSNLDAITKLGGSINTFNQDQLNKMLESAIPGYKSMVSSIGGKVNDLLGGNIPQDVADQIKRDTAFQSLRGGFGGSAGSSGIARNLTARDLGLTSLDLVTKGIDAGTRWIQAAKSATVAPEFDVTSMFITPAQRIATVQANNTGQFQRNWMQNQLDAEYAVGTQAGRALSDAGQGITSIASSVAGSAAGKMM